MSTKKRVGQENGEVRRATEKVEKAEFGEPVKKESGEEANATRRGTPGRKVCRVCAQEVFPGHVAPIPSCPQTGQ